MSTLPVAEYSVQTAYVMLHKLLLESRLSHVKAKPVFAKHIAFERAYDAINDIIDEITEQLIGYSDTDPTSLPIGTVQDYEVRAFGKKIISEAAQLEKFAETAKYPNIVNKAQELSGLGAQLIYLSRFDR